MADSPSPTVAAVIAAYQAEKWIADAIDSILGQTSPPDEVIVVDDGSTDGTARELAKFGNRVRVIRRENGGCPAAFNTAFAAVRCDFVAMCGADDIWEPGKLELQRAAIAAHPEVDFFCGHAVMTGLIEGDHTRPPGVGVLDSDALRDELFAEGCVINAPSIVIRRAVFERLGPFIENFGADDYEYWFRALRAGSRFYYEPRPLVSWRQHGENLSWKTAWMDECSYKVLRTYEGDVEDRRVRARGFAPIFFRAGRRQVDDGEAGRARRSFARSLRYWRGQSPTHSARALAWIAVLSLPASARAGLGAKLVKLKRAFGTLLGNRRALRA
jgi:glycosyltransferase involved in cell wall biosynthesis